MSDFDAITPAVKALQITLDQLLEVKSKMGSKFPLKLQEETERVEYMIVALDANNPNGVYIGPTSASPEDITTLSQKYLHLSKNALLLKLAEAELLLKNKTRQSEALSALLIYLEDEAKKATDKRRHTSEQKQKGKVIKSAHHKAYAVKAREILDQLRNDHKLSGNDFLGYRIRMRRKVKEDEIIASEQTIRNLFKKITGISSTKKTHTT
jgi:hypothetical protein